MKQKRFFALMLTFVMLVSTLASCGVALPLTQKELALDSYSDEVQAADTAFLSGLGDLRVMSYNVLTTMSGNATLKQNRYQAVLQEIQGYAPTLLGLQEDASHWNTFLTEQLVTKGTYKRINSSVGSGEYCSIYYDTAVLGEAVASGAYWLTHSGKSGANALKWEDVPQRHRDALAMTQASHMRSNHAISCYIDGQLYTETDAVLDVRLMSYGIFELNGQKFLYVNTHLQHRSQNGKLAVNIPEFLELREMERKAEWDILTANVDKLLSQYGDMPVIITGDLNDVMGSASYYHFAEKYDNASKLAKLRKGHDASWNAAFSSSENGKLFSEVILKDGQASTTLDYCFITPDAFTVEQYQTGEGRQYITSTNGSKGYVYCSDHLPIIIDLSFGKDKDAPTVALQKPGFETSAISVYDASKGADTSWYDSSKPDGEYTLTTANQLAGFLALRQKQGMTSCKMQIKLGANMVLGDMELAWQVSDDYLFEGAFDGQGHYVSFNANGARGLLGALGNATVKNLSLWNSSLVVASDNPQSGYGSVASMVAEDKIAALYNIDSNCTVSQSCTAENIGGLVGVIGSGAMADFRYCNYSGSINTAECNAVGGIVGALESYSAVSLYNSANAGKLNGNKYTGGLIGLSLADKLYVSNSANVGDIVAGRCSGGLIGCIETCNDLIVSNCAVMADLDFSSIGAGGTESNPVTVAAGCQVGGLVGRTYNVQGGFSGITLSGSIKGATNLLTKLDKDTNDIFVDYLASGCIVGFNSVYANDEKVMIGKKGYSNLHFDTILVAMDATDLDSYFGGTRDVAIDQSGSRISLRDIVYDKAKYEASGLPMWGVRIDQNRRIDDGKETNSQLESPNEYDTEEFYLNENFDAKVNIAGDAINHYSWMPKYSAWTTVPGDVMVSTTALRDVIRAARKSVSLWNVGYQTRVNASDSAKTDFRFVSAIDPSVNNTAVGHLITLSYVNEAGELTTTQNTVYSNVVYNSIKGGDLVYTAEQFGEKYLYTLEILEIPTTLYKNIMISVTPFTSGADGESITYYNETTYVLN